MIYVNIFLTVNDAADIDTVKDLLITQGELSRAEPGCGRFEVYHSQEDPLLFVLNEHWETQAHLEAHRQAKAFTTIYAPKVLPLVNRVPHPCDRISA